ncbi:sigma-70 family RNA polymerase sigma factor [Actinomycetes bacterium KLBMP 9759]
MADEVHGSSTPDRLRTEDRELVASVATGSPAALAALYDRYGRRAYSLAVRICADEKIAEDVVQEAFIAFWRDPGRFDASRGQFSSWFLTLVHHKSVDAVRSEERLRRHTAPAAPDEPSEGGADKEALDAVTAGQVRSALADLPADQRRALALAYFAGYTQREVAALTGVPLGTVKSRMFSGIQRLRNLLGPVTGDSETFDGGPA